MSFSVLIVDDSLTVRMDLKEAFESDGYACTSAADIAQARDALKQHSFDLIILDVLLPDGSGIELLAELKKDPATSATPVMMLSTEADVRARVQGLSTGADAYIGKPYEKDYLLYRAKELLSARENTPRSATPATLLVIDDSKTYRQWVKELIEPIGYRVVEAESGERGLRVAARTRPVAIVVDGMMPGVDGITVVRRLRGDALLRGIPCVFVTESEDRSMELRALESGADAFVRKSEGSASLLAKLGSLVHREEAAAIDASAAGYFGAKRLLAVGTDNTYFAALGEQLREEQWEIAVAPSIAEARELLKVECVDCLVIEAALADESTVREIKETLDPQIPLMILANDASISEVFLRASSAGADDLLLKFVDFSVIKAQLRNRLQRKQIEAERRKAAEAQTRHSIDIAEARAAKELAAVRSALVIELEHKNAELLAARESALRASQAKSEFLANMSREIHAPLTSIIDQTRSLLDMKLNCEQQAIAREVSDHAGSILAVMNHLPDFSEISDVSQKADTQHTAAATEPGRKFRILLVDDNGTNRKLALCQLDHLGYLADAVTNGREALDTIARVPFDLVLMDCCLPEMDGYEAARQIRQRERAGQHIPIIAMSANSSDEGKYLDAGMDEYISKPVEIENLAAVLERVLRSQGKAASAVSATDANNRTDPTDGAQGPTLDAATMASLRAEKDLLPGLIETASKEVPEQLQQIADAIGRADDETASIAAHNLKGTAAIFGARRMKNCAAALEHAVNSGSTEKALSTLELLRKECDRLLRELESEGARPATRNQRPPVAP